MSQWLRRPPSRQRLIVIGVAVAACVLLFAIERIWGWPSWLTVNGRTMRVPRHL